MYIPVFVSVHSVYIAVSVLLVSGTLCATHGQSAPPHARVNGSDVFGLVKEWDGREYQAFLGIRYGRPPVGNLRFARSDLNPLPPVLNATARGAHCYPVEPDDLASEDCLFLNIFAPGNTTEADTKAVLFFIHGGGNIVGNTDRSDAIPLVLHGDVIMVTVNYRLGPLGFLSTLTAHAPGNAGFWDQNLALTWVSRYISSFGGDPQRITVYGVSAGAKATSLHTVSHHSRGLFARALMGSGTLYGPSLYAWDPVSTARLMASRFGCPTSDLAELVTCLRGQPADQLSQAGSDVWPHDDVRFLIDFGWGAVVDGDFLTQDAAQPGTFTGQVMATVNNNEGSLLGLWRIPQLDKHRRDAWARLSQCNQFSARYINQTLQQSFKGDPAEYAINLVADFYIRCQGDQRVNLSSAMLLYGDQQYLAPAVKYLRSRVATGPAYFYYFDHDVPAHWNQATIFRGAQHGEDGRYLMGWTNVTDLDPVTFQRERKLSDVMMTYLANFLKTGDPNSPSPVPVHFPEFDHDKGGIFLHMNSDMLDPSKAKGQVGSDFLHDRMKLWLEELPDQGSVLPLVG